MRVGLNTAILQRGASGTARAAAHIQAALEDAPGFDLVAVSPRPRAHRGRLRRAWADAHWDLWAAPRRVKPCDVFISPSNIGRTPKSVAHVLWIHDTMVLDHPEWYDRAYAAYARLLFGFSARASTVVVTVSRWSARKIEQRWPGVAPVRVIRWPADVQTDKPRAMGNPPWEVLMVGRTVGRKNHTGAIDAVRIARLISGADIRLAIVGGQGDAEADVRAAGSVADPDGRWLRRVPEVSDQCLTEMYAKAWALINPAFDEGFGLPLLEAASHGLPAVHSGLGSMSEVVSSGGVGSASGSALADGLLELLDPARYQSRSAMVLNDARAYSREDFRRDLTGLLHEVHP